MAILRVVAKPEFGELNTAISNLQGKQIKLNFDQANQGADALAGKLKNVSNVFDKDGNLIKQVKTYKNELGQTSKETIDFTKSLDKTKESVKKTGEEIKKTSGFTDLMGDSFLKIAAKMWIWQSLGNAISAVRRSFYDALDTMKAVDDELVTVRKVTGATADELEKIEKQAYKTASAYGVAANEYLESVAAFARAGYGDRASGLAELSTKVQIVGDTTAEVANQMLLSVDAAYKYGGSIERLSQVVDHMNEVDNKFPTSISKVSEGLGIVAPVAAQLGVSIEELTAMLGTITAVTQRSGSEAARALRSILINMTSDINASFEDVNGETVYTIGEINGLHDVVKEYAEDLYDTAQKTGKVLNPVEVINALAQAAAENRLSEQKLYDLVTDESGKLRASQLWALIQNWNTMYKDQLEAASTAVGSADREVENALDSWTVKTNQVKNSWTELVNNIADTRLIKGALDFVYLQLQRLNHAFDGGMVWEDWNKTYGYAGSYRESGLWDENGNWKENPFAETTYDVNWLNKYKDAISKVDEEWKNGILTEEEYINKLKQKQQQADQVTSALRKYREEGEELSDAQNEMISVDDRLIDRIYRLEHAGISAAQATNEQIIAEKNLKLAAQTDAISACNIIVEGENQKLASINMTTAAVYDQVDALALLAHKEYVARRMADSNGGDTLSEIERMWNASAEGQYWGNAIITAGRARATENRGGISVGGGGGGGGSGGTTSTSATKSKAEILRAAMNDVLEKEKERRDEEIAAIDDQIAALKEENDLEQQSLDLEEKKAEVIKRQNDLLLAQQERTIRLYNSKTKQWEWVADATKVQNAQDALEKARQALADYRRKIALDAAAKELEDRKKAINAAYDLVEKQWQAAIKSLEEPAYDMADILSILNTDLSGFDLVLASANQAIADGIIAGKAAIANAIQNIEIPTAKTGIVTSSNKKSSNPSTGFSPEDADNYGSTNKFADYVEKNTKPSSGSTAQIIQDRKEQIIQGLKTPRNTSTNGRKNALMDSGGILRGLGGIKATGADEIIVPPSIASRMLSPSADNVFRMRMNELGYMYGATSNAPATLLSSGIGSVTNNNGATYNLGGISLTEGQAKTTTVYELAQLAHGLRIYS